LFVDPLGQVAILKTSFRDIWWCADKGVDKGVDRGFDRWEWLSEVAAVSLRRTIRNTQTMPTRGRTKYARFEEHFGVVEQHSMMVQLSCRQAQHS